MSEALEASPYRDCGKCPYLGGCTHCENPEWREIIYTRIALARASALEEAAKVAEADYTPAYGPDKAAMEDLASRQRRAIAERIRSLKGGSQ